MIMALGKPGAFLFCRHFLSKDNIVSYRMLSDEVSGVETEEQAEVLAASKGNESDRVCPVVRAK